MITNGFQVATGLRVVGQSLKGTYSGTMTKTIPISAKKLWDFCISEKGLEIWLKPMSPVEITKGESFEVDGGIFGEIRTVKKGSRIRLSWTEIDWDKITTVQLSIFKKPKGKSMLVFQHEGLRTAQQKVQMRTYWRKAIEEMARQVPHA